VSKSDTRLRQLIFYCICDKRVSAAVQILHISGSVRDASGNVEKMIGYMPQTSVDASQVQDKFMS